MNVDDAAFDALTDASRELHLAVDGGGRVVYADGRAHRLLGIAVGDVLRAHCAPGCEAKLDDLLREARRAAVDDWELPFVVGDRALTVALSARPHDGGSLIVGHVLPEVFVDAMGQVSAMIEEAAELNRVIRRQRDQLAERNEELQRLNQQLGESNRGILAMHAEIAAGLEASRQDNEIKARVVANLSHELRTPLHSILGLTSLLASGADGALAPEQEKQIRYIRASAEELLTLVNDVLDLGQLESGNARVRVGAFDLGDFVSSLRGTLRPLAPERGAVELVIEDPPEGVALDTDRYKLAQIVRNLVSNALKFTERGEVRVRFAAEGDDLRVTVTDTGIGIPAADHDRIFEEYAQVESHLQARIKGTGLGLPVSRRLATLLGGSLTVESEPGRGACFTLTLPLRHDEARMMNEMLERSRTRAPDASSILVVEDDRRTLFLYEKYLVMAGFHVMPARTVEEAQALLAQRRPAAIVLDVMLEGDASWGFLARVKQDPHTADIPVLVVTVTNRESKARALGADEFWLKPVDQDRLLRRLKAVARTGGEAVRILVIDDDETARYIIKQHLSHTPYDVIEAATGDEGVSAARKLRPDVILLDFLLQGTTAFDVLDELKADPHTRTIPVIIVTSHVLDTLDQNRLLQEAESVISKQALSRELAINRIRDALRKFDRGGGRPT